MIEGESEADESGAAMAGEAPQSPRSEAGHVSGGWQDPHIPPPGARVVELVRVRSVALTLFFKQNVQDGAKRLREEAGEPAGDAQHDQLGDSDEDTDVDEQPEP